MGVCPADKEAVTMCTRYECPYRLGPLDEVSDKRGRFERIL
jgi:hypothetical protein